MWDIQEVYMEAMVKLNEQRSAHDDMVVKHQNYKLM